MNNQPLLRTMIGGIDEAGRGPLAGPVVAAAVVLAEGQRIRGVRDSKLLTPDRREWLAERIRAGAVSWAIGVATVDEIDTLNILQASLLAMRRAFAGLGQVPERVQVDGVHDPVLAGFSGPVETVIGGDRLCLPVSAASILAKVHRDGLMVRLHREYPGYGFDRHKGYGTAEHQSALQTLGPCPIHRRSFAPVRLALESGVGAGFGPDTDGIA